MQANWQEVFVLFTQTVASTSQHTNKQDGLAPSPDTTLSITLHVPQSVLLIDKKGLFLNTETHSAGVSVAFALPAVRGRTAGVPSCGKREYYTEHNNVLLIPRHLPPPQWLKEATWEDKLRF